MSKNLNSPPGPFLEPSGLKRHLSPMIFHQEGIPCLLALGRSVAMLLLIGCVGWAGIGCQSTQSTAEPSQQTPEERAATEKRVGPARVTWIDFEQARRKAAADPAKKSRKIGIDRLILVTPNFEGGRFKKALSLGKLAPSTKVIEAQFMEELLDALETIDFYDLAQAVPPSSFSQDQKVRAVISVEQDGKPTQTLVHMKGAGGQGRDTVETFIRSKSLVHKAYNMTTQFGHITIKQAQK